MFLRNISCQFESDQGRYFFWYKLGKLCYNIVVSQKQSDELTWRLDEIRSTPAAAPFPLGRLPFLRGNVGGGKKRREKTKKEHKDR